MSPLLFEEALRLNPNELNGWMFGAAAKMWLGEHQTAIDYCERALRVSPLDPRIFFAQTTLAFSYFFVGDYEQGYTCAMTASRHHPNFPPALRAAMACSAMSGKSENAQKLWRQVALLSPSDRVSTHRVLIAFRRNQDRAKLGEAFRIAGMPE